ncbi:hypothetical protein HHK36_023145 [Tetracentron sinense]|uniref:Uncharacterized protein n=1 Tax=Tetracentron sinense TaxID=13715 RepID=A0A834YSL5_TETSI|nr:hypothetical protein HHK36_023145 [Tetracentron sinense]
MTTNLFLSAFIICRPWVVTEKILRLRAFVGTFGGFMPKSKNKSWNRSVEFDDEIKVVYSGTEGYKKGFLYSSFSAMPRGDQVCCNTKFRVVSTLVYDHSQTVSCGGCTTSKK